MTLLARISRLAVCALVLCACASQRPSTPIKLPPAPESHSEAPELRQEEAPPLIAPPPAYGNKVVMARGSAPPGVN
ncbi:MAG TPA: hypothetical protein VF989_17505 [Polyangiaceae bacterium]